MPEHTGGDAARDVLAPVREVGAEAHDRAVDYLVHGTSSEVLTALGAGGEVRLDVDARRALYATAPPATLARFGELLNALDANGRTRDDVPAWLLRLVDDVAAALFATDTGSGTSEAVARWTPAFVADVARAGGVPADIAALTVLLALLHRKNRADDPVDAMVITPAGDAYLAEHADLLPDVADRLTRHGKRFFLECVGRNLDAHRPLVSALADDPDQAVRRAARALLTPPEATLPEDLRDKLHRFRATAAVRGLSTRNVERWLRTALPGAMMSPKADGPVVGRLGSPLMLPPDRDRVDGQLIATIDLAAIPEGATDLPLPPDGHLLLFADAELEDVLTGGAVHVPAGTPVEERPQDLDYQPYEHDTPEDLDADLRDHGELRLARDVSLVLHQEFHEGEVGSAVNAAWDEAVAGIRSLAHVPLQIGGNASDHEGWGDPVLGSASALDEEVDPREDWVLLAQWEGLPMATVYWTIPRQDLADRRFDRVVVQMYANP
ncbi:MAG: DUF1963 domain-containing protein [Saccharothrix sp.]|nr:DUF1963 domain-containing protein [Saccharothrix sp.]